MASPLCGGSHASPGLPGSQAALTTLGHPWACPTAPSLYLHPLCIPPASLLRRGTIGSPKECAPEALTLVPIWTKGQ